MRANLGRCAFLALAGVVQVGCGGSSSGGSEDSAAESKTVPLSGVASMGAPLANSSVQARCKGEQGFITSVATDSNGSFRGEVNTDALPCALRVDGGAQRGQLHSWADSPGVVNITQLTDLAIAISSTVLPETWFEQAGRAERLSNLESAKAELLGSLRGSGYSVPDGGFDLFHTELSMGSEAARLLSDLDAAIAESSAFESYAALVSVISDGNLTLMPAALEPSDSDGSGGGFVGGGGSSAKACMPRHIKEGTEVRVVTRNYGPATPEGHMDWWSLDSVGGMVEFRGNVVQVLESQSSFDLSDDQPSYFTRSYFLVDESAHHVQAFGGEVLASQGGRPTMVTWFEPSNDTRFDLQPGESYRSVYTDYTKPASGDISQMVVDQIHIYEGRETITTPAGTFETCKFLEVDTDFPSFGGFITWTSVEHGVDIQYGGRQGDGNEEIYSNVLSLEINGVQAFP